MTEDYYATLSPNDILMSIPTPISVLVADDHALVRASIVAMLNNEPEIAVIGEATNGADAIEKARDLAPDVVVMDMGMPLVGGISATEEITGARNAPRVLIISQFEEEEYIRDSMKAGAGGYVLKDALVAELPHAIRVVYDGGHFFSPRIAQRIVGFYLKSVVPAPQS
ncbi:MAG: response regulator transcription factor [Bacteroidetes bacterium]|nr:response regulator transcription factor [Bacteroidota bacterium]